MYLRFDDTLECLITNCTYSPHVGIIYSSQYTYYGLPSMAVYQHRLHTVTIATPSYPIHKTQLNETSVSKLQELFTAIRLSTYIYV